MVNIDINHTYRSLLKITNEVRSIRLIELSNDTSFTEICTMITIINYNRLLLVTTEYIKLTVTHTHIYVCYALIFNEKYFFENRKK